MFFEEFLRKNCKKICLFEITPIHLYTKYINFYLTNFIIN